MQANCFTCYTNCMDNRQVVRTNAWLTPFYTGQVCLSSRLLVKHVEIIGNLLNHSCNEYCRSLNTSFSQITITNPFFFYFFHFIIAETIAGSKYNWYIFCLHGADWGYLGLAWPFLYCPVREDVGILVDIWYDLSWPAMVENVLVTFDDSPVSGNTHGWDFQSCNNNAEVSHKRVW